MSEGIFRVISVNPGANSKATTYVKASRRLQAKHYIEDLYSQHYVESITACNHVPDEYEVHQAGGA